MDQRGSSTGPGAAAGTGAGAGPGAGAGTAEWQRAGTAEWQRMVAAMQARAQAVDWSKVDWSKLSPSDIGVRFGAPMTEAEFAEYRKRRGSVHVIKPGQAAKGADATAAPGASGGGRTKNS